LQRLVTEAQALKRAEKPLTRVQQQALSVSDRLTLLARVMDRRVFLIVPAPGNETDPWVEPALGGSRYYADAQFAPIQTQLQTVANAYVQGDGFNLNRAANQLREDLRALSPSIYPRDQQLRLEYFYNHFGFGIGGETYAAIFVALDLLFVAFAIWRYRKSATASVALSEIEPERASAQL
jgi:hypothetical protein